MGSLVLAGACVQQLFRRAKLLLWRNTWKVSALVNAGALGVGAVSYAWRTRGLLGACTESALESVEAVTVDHLANEYNLAKG